MEASAGQGADPFVWLAAGRVTPAKDYPNLLRAFGQVSKDCANSELWIAGAPALTERKRTVNQVSRDVNVAALERGHEQVRWLGLCRDMPALLDAADGFVLASAWEGMPLALGEAMAMEKPIVATGVGGVRELVGDSGAVVAPKDSDALAEAMIAVMRQSGEERAHLGLMARERVVRHFNIDATADAWEAHYRGLLV
jgi:glycosyltransferase involved in cell wall biosynthesis